MIIIDGNFAIMMILKLVHLEIVVKHLLPELVVIGQQMFSMEVLIGHIVVDQPNFRSMLDPIMI